VAQQTRCQRSKLIDPPPPTSRASFARLGPHHAQGRVEGGEISGHDIAISRRNLPEVCYQISSPIRGRRECRAPDAPASRVCNGSGRTHTRWSGHTGITRHSPRNGFNGFLRALPGDRAFLPPSPAKIVFRQLDASVGASGPHDFAVRQPHRPSSAPPASTASRSAFRDVAQRPSVVRDGGVIRVIWAFGKSEYFCKEGWTEGSINCPGDLPVGLDP